MEEDPRERGRGPFYDSSSEEDSDDESMVYVVTQRVSHDRSYCDWNDPLAPMLDAYQFRDPDGAERSTLHTTGEVTCESQKDLRGKDSWGVRVNRERARQKEEYETRLSEVYSENTFQIGGEPTNGDPIFRESVEIGRFTKDGVLDYPFEYPDEYGDESERDSVQIAKLAKLRKQDHAWLEQKVKRQALGYADTSAIDTHIHVPALKSSYEGDEQVPYCEIYAEQVKGFTASEQILKERKLEANRELLKKYINERELEEGRKLTVFCGNEPANKKRKTEH